jgi:hypothetical protein
MLIALIYTALITPFNVAFLELSYDFMFVLDRIVDAFFLADMVLQFLLAYTGPDGRMQYNSSMIARRSVRD